MFKHLSSQWSESMTCWCWVESKHMLTIKLMKPAESSLPFISHHLSDKVESSLFSWCRWFNTLLACVFCHLLFPMIVGATLQQNNWQKQFLLSSFFQPNLCPPAAFQLLAIFKTTFNWNSKSCLKRTHSLLIWIVLRSQLKLSLSDYCPDVCSLFVKLKPWISQILRRPQYHNANHQLLHKYFLSLQFIVQFIRILTLMKDSWICS